MHRALPRAGCKYNMVARGLSVLEGVLPGFRAGFPAPVPARQGMYV